VLSNSTGVNSCTLQRRSPIFHFQIGTVEI